MPSGKKSGYSSGCSYNSWAACRQNILMFRFDWCCHCKISPNTLNKRWRCFIYFGQLPDKLRDKPPGSCYTFSILKACFLKIFRRGWLGLETKACLPNPGIFQTPPHACDEILQHADRLLTERLHNMLYKHPSCFAKHYRMEPAWVAWEKRSNR